MWLGYEYELAGHDSPVSRSLDAVIQQAGRTTVGVAVDHHAGLAERRVRVDRVPLDSVADEVVVVRAALVVDAVEMRLKTAAEPPRAAVVPSAVVIETGVVVAETSQRPAFVVSCAIICRGVARN